MPTLACNRQDNLAGKIVAIVTNVTIATSSLQLKLYLLLKLKVFAQIVTERVLFHILSAAVRDGLGNETTLVDRYHLNPLIIR
ncbi:MAG: hypothetical protein U0930_18825 [Pirellulales bacterium]